MPVVGPRRKSTTRPAWWTKSTSPGKTHRHTPLSSLSNGTSNANEECGEAIIVDSIGRSDTPTQDEIFINTGIYTGDNSDGKVLVTDAHSLTSYAQSYNEENSVTKAVNVDAKKTPEGKSRDQHTGESTGKAKEKRRASKDPVRKNSESKRFDVSRRNGNHISKSGDDKKTDREGIHKTSSTKDSRSRVRSSDSQSTRRASSLERSRSRPSRETSGSRGSSTNSRQTSSSSSKTQRSQSDVSNQTDTKHRKDAKKPDSDTKRKSSSEDKTYQRSHSSGHSNGSNSKHSTNTSTKQDKGLQKTPSLQKESSFEKRKENTTLPASGHKKNVQVTSGAQAEKDLKNSQRQEVQHESSASGCLPSPEDLQRFSPSHFVLKDEIKAEDHEDIDRDTQASIGVAQPNQSSKPDDAASNKPVSKSGSTDSQIKEEQPVALPPSKVKEMQRERRTKLASKQLKKANWVVVKSEGSAEVEGKKTFQEKLKAISRHSVQPSGSGSFSTRYQSKLTKVRLPEEESYLSSYVQKYYLNTRGNYVEGLRPLLVYEIENEKFTTEFHQRRAEIATAPTNFMIPPELDDVYVFKFLPGLDKLDDFVKNGMTVSGQSDHPEKLINRASKKNAVLVFKASDVCLAWGRRTVDRSKPIVLLICKAIYGRTKQLSFVNDRHFILPKASVDSIQSSFSATAFENLVEGLATTKVLMADIDNQAKHKDRPRQLLPFGFVIYVHDDLTDGEESVILRQWYDFKDKKIDGKQDVEPSRYASIKEKPSTSNLGFVSKQNPMRQKSAFFRHVAKKESQSKPDAKRERPQKDRVKKETEPKSSSKSESRVSDKVKSESRSRSRSQSKEQSGRKRTHSASSLDASNKLSNRSSPSASKSKRSKSSISSNSSVDMTSAADIANNNHPKSSLPSTKEEVVHPVSTHSEVICTSTEAAAAPTLAITPAMQPMYYRPEPIRLRDAEVQVKMTSIISLQKKALMLSASTQTPNLETDTSYEATLLRGGPLKPVNPTNNSLSAPNGPQIEPPMEIKLYMNKTQRERQHYTLSSRFAESQDHNIFDDPDDPTVSRWDQMV